MTILLIVFGFLGGILGGMGMGGGTLLIPLLSFLDIPQRTIQAINLIGFLPMSAVALFSILKTDWWKQKYNLAHTARRPVRDRGICSYRSFR